MSKIRKLTKCEIDTLREYISYDPISGSISWAKSLGRKIKRGDKAGYAKDNRYIVFELFGRRYGAHRAILAIQTGFDTDLEVDHINGDKQDNRLENLRRVSSSVNMQNQRKAKASSKTGVLGVSPKGATSRFVAQIKVDGKTKAIGIFDTVEAASNAYLREKRRLHEGCTL
jgi:hypothetical protein